MRFTFHKLNTRLMALLLAAVLLLAAAPAVSAAEISGDCGSGLTWSFADGRLTISGSGDMTDYGEKNLPPWYDYRDRILWLTLPEGLTSVGSMAFYDCVNLTAVAIPDSVADIGELAFCQNRGMTMLTLGSGLRSIGRSAFEQCDNLKDVRLPQGLTTLGTQAFYSCGSISYITIPASVARMDTAVFAYCHSLIRADVYAAIEVLPTWTFYGCDRLSTVYLPDTMRDTEGYAFYGCDALNTVTMGGTSMDPEELKEKIDQDVPGFDRFGDVTSGESEGSGSSTDISENEDGGYTVENATATQTENTTVTTTTSETVSEKGASTKVNITATVVSPEGWDEVLDQIENAQTLLEDKDPDGTVNVTVYTGASDQIPQQVLDALAGTNVKLTVQTQSGSRFTMDMTNLGENVSDSVELTYNIATLAEPAAELDSAVTYALSFQASTAVNAEVMIRLPGGHSRSTATLYQRTDSLNQLQSVIVDDAGYAHFYLGAVDNETEYLIGIDVPGLRNDEAIIPDELLQLMGFTDNVAEVEYVVTGRASSWNMNINQVTYIMVGVLLTVVVTVAVVMFLLNKRKLKRGYVPDIDEEDYNT